MNETIKDNIIEIEEVKPYIFRTLSAEDVFPMFTIISKIGVNEFAACFDGEKMQAMIQQAANGGEGNKAASIVGVSVVLEIANVLCSNLPKCKDDIYKLLAQTSNLTADEIKTLDAVVFLQMVIDFIKKDEFKDFIKVVSKLFK